MSQSKQVDFSTQLFSILLTCLMKTKVLRDFILLYTVVTKINIKRHLLRTCTYNAIKHVARLTVV